MKQNRRSDAAGFPGDGKPPKSKLSRGFPDDFNKAGKTIVMKAIDDGIHALGGPIHKIIMWHMNNHGVFADPEKIDINFFYDNLRELVGPGADIIMEETWHHLMGRRF